MFTFTTLRDVNVIDSFGKSWPLSAPTDWSLFASTGLDANSIVIWATARTPLSGPVIDDVVIGMDEDANLVWAVEQTVSGQTLATPTPAPDPPATQTDPTVPPTFSYLAMTPVPPHWHPYVIDENVNGLRRFVQGRAADLSGPTPTLLPAPISDLLADPHAPAAGPFHQLEPAAIPPDGLRLQRRAMLARAITGDPVLWTQRRRDLMIAPPTSGLRFDLLKQDHPAPPSA